MLKLEFLCVQVGVSGPQILVLDVECKWTFYFYSPEQQIFLNFHIFIWSENLGNGSSFPLFQQGSLHKFQINIYVVER